MSLYLLDNTLVFGTLSANNTISDLYGNSNQWNSVYSTLCAQSGNNTSVYTTVKSYSTDWQNMANAGTSFVTYSNLGPLTGKWESNYSTVCAYSANWQSVYAYVNGASSVEANQTSVFSTVCAYSGNWQSVYATFNTQSGNNASVFTTLCAQSGNNTSVYSTVCAYSANWQNMANAGTSFVTYSNLGPLTGKWESNYSTTNTYSADWQNTTSWVKNNSANAVFTTSVSTKNISADALYINGVKMSGAFNKAASSIGNGALSTFIYAHGLNSTDVSVMVYDNTSKDVVTPTINISTLNTVTLTFSTPPALNKYRVIVTA
jgi:hypothetical protein